MSRYTLLAAAAHVLGAILLFSALPIGIGLLFVSWNAAGMAIAFEVVIAVCTGMVVGGVLLLSDL
jgi:hypothetical protein